MNTTLIRKFEDKSNKLLNIIKKLPLKKEEIDYINMCLFFYSVDRENILQEIAVLTDIARRYKIPLTDIKNALK